MYALFLYHVALDLVGLAKGYALPHLPRMPELRRVDTSSFVPHPSPASEIKYKDKFREKQRKQNLERLKQGGILSDKYFFSIVHFKFPL